MKKIFLLSITLFIVSGIWAQQAPPQGINYQATVYVPVSKMQPAVNSVSQIPANKEVVEVTFTIEEGNNGPLVYEEKHQDTTDQFGLLDLIIGLGTPTGNSPGLFNQIDWSVGDPHLRVSIVLTEYNTTISSYQKLWSVPYALYSDRSNSSGYSDSSGHAATADTALYSFNSGHAATADTALYSFNSGHANTADTALYSFNSGHAAVADTALNAWRLTGNLGTNPNTNFIGTIDNQDWVVKTNNTERMRVMADGKVGIGLVNPTEKLELQNGGIRINGFYGIGFNDQSFANSTPNGNEGAKIYFDNTVTVNPNKDYLVIEKKDGSSVNPDGGIVFTNRGNDGISRPSMIIDGNGNIGIGEINPAFNLHVQGTIFTRGAMEFGTNLGFTSFPLNVLHSRIYSTQNLSVNPPFNNTSNLVIQSSSQLGRDIWLVTGTIPRERLVIRGQNAETHDVLLNNTLYIVPRNTSPTNPVQGYMYYDSVLNKLRVYDGTTWQNCW